MKILTRSLVPFSLLAVCLPVLALLMSNGKASAGQAPLKGYSVVIPWKGGTAKEALAATHAAATIPLASFKFQATKDGHYYTNVIAGQSPFASPPAATHVKVLVVPMVIHIGNHVFDSTAANSCGGSMRHSGLQNFLNSPLLTPATFDGGTGAGHAARVNGVNMGTDTYNDTHRRAEFLKAIGGPSSAYRTVFDVTVAPAQTISAAASAGHSAIIYNAGGCTLLGGLEINFFDNYFANTVLPAVQATPASFVVLLMRDTVLYDTHTSNCCILGYHGTLGNLQTYAPVDYDTTGDFGPGIVNVSIAAHEIGEWLDDPLGTNPAPPWGNIGQVSGCQSNWEVGDPLTGTNFPAIKMANGVTYNPQETAFWSWYYSKDHSAYFQQMTAGGKYSMHGTFAGPSRPCQPGGTFPN